MICSKKFRKFMCKKSRNNSSSSISKINKEKVIVPQIKMKEIEIVWIPLAYLTVFSLVKNWKLRKKKSGGNTLLEDNYSSYNMTKHVKD